MRTAGVAFGLVVTIVCFGGCRGGPRERVTLATAPLPVFGLVFIAEGRGYFAEQGITVVQRRFSAGRYALAALVAREVDAATACETPTASAGVKQADLQVLTTLHVTNSSTHLVARADRGIRTGADLAGKRVGVPLGTRSEFFLHVLLAYSGVPDRSVREIDVPPDRAVDALVSGEVDAVAIWPPHVERARRLLGRDASVEIGTPLYTEISMLVTRSDVLRERREALVKVVRALAQAEKLVREHPDEAFATLRKEIGGDGEADLLDAWRRIQPGLGLTNQLAAVLERESEWLRSEGRIAGPPIDVGRMLRTDVLAEVEPEAVTFVSRTPLRSPR